MQGIQNDLNFTAEIKVDILGYLTLYFTTDAKIWEHWTRSKKTKNSGFLLVSTVQWMDSLLWLWCSPCSPWCLIRDIWWGGAHCGDMDTDNDDSHCDKAWCWSLPLLWAITLRRNQSRDFYTWREKRYSPVYIRQSANQRAGLWFRPMRAQGSQHPKTNRETSTSGHLRPSHFSQPKHNTLGGPHPKLVTINIMSPAERFYDRRMKLRHRCCI